MNRYQCDVESTVLAAIPKGELPMARRQNPDGVYKWRRMHAFAPRARNCANDTQGYRTVKTGRSGCGWSVSQPPRSMLGHGHSSDPIMPRPMLVLLILLSILLGAGSASSACSLTARSERSIEATTGTATASTMSASNTALNVFRIISPRLASLFAAPQPAGLLPVA